MTNSYRVGGMTCGGCARSVTAAVGAALGGAPVTVDLAAGTLDVGGPHDAAAVRDAVERAGFEFLGDATGEAGGGVPPAGR